MMTAEDILKSKGYALYSVPVTATITQATETMAEKRIGSIVVKDGEKIVGIWTERDLLRNTAEAGFDPKTARIADYMKRDLKVAPCTDSIFQLMDKFLGLRLRRMLIEREGRIIGLLTAGDVMRACLEEKNRELRSLNAMVGWDYYEDWKWEQRSDSR
jgi:signal-transduction protein with cAMP-binding, CBS, and nucleotidyltransferase domain